MSISSEKISTKLNPCISNTNLGIDYAPDNPSTGSLIKCSNDNNEKLIDFNKHNPGYKKIDIVPNDIYIIENYKSLKQSDSGKEFLDEVSNDCLSGKNPDVYELILDVVSEKHLYNGFNRDFPNIVPRTCEGAILCINPDDIENKNLRILNPYLKSCRKHYDECIRPSKGKHIESKLTACLTLNDMPDGNITFIDPSGIDHISPAKAGCLLIFQQKEWEHYGDPNKEGKKYTIFCSIFYEYMRDHLQTDLICNQCNANIKNMYIELSCKHLFYCCDCPPYSVLYDIRNEGPKKCFICQK